MFPRTGLFVEFEIHLVRKIMNNQGPYYVETVATFNTHLKHGLSSILEPILSDSSFEMNCRNLSHDTSSEAGSGSGERQLGIFTGLY